MLQRKSYRALWCVSTIKAARWPTHLMMDSLDAAASWTSWLIGWLAGSSWHSELAYRCFTRHSTQFLDELSLLCSTLLFLFLSFHKYVLHFQEKDLAHFLGSYTLYVFSFSAR